MNTTIDCIPCFVRQSLEAARLFTPNPAIHERIMREVLHASAALDFRQSPPTMAQWIHRRLHELTGETDPYRSQKDRHNTFAMGLLPELREKIRTAEDPFGLAVRLAIAGNVIDLGVYGHVDDAQIRHAVDNALNEPFVGDLDTFRKACEKAKRILYLADNAGEIVFDKLLIERLPAGRVVLVVRGGPILNDATRADAAAVSLDENTEVIDNGSDAPGTILDDCSSSFREQFERADLIIAKGQGNFETLSEVQRPIFFLFKAKCPVIACHACTEVGTHVLCSPTLGSDLAAEQTNASSARQSARAYGRAVRVYDTQSDCQEHENLTGMTIPDDLQRCIDFHGHLCPGLVAATAPPNSVCRNWQHSGHPTRNGSPL